MTKKTALLLGSGEDVPKMLPKGLINEDFLVVCADDGATLAYKWGVSPDIIIGDEDSIQPLTKEYWLAHGVPFARYPSRKDQTDLELAIDYALKQGVTRFVLAGVWGSRIDHSLGNLDLLYRLAKDNISHELLTATSRLIASSGSFTAEVAKGSIVSLLPLTAKVENVESDGLLYPLQNSELKKGSTLGISNEAIAEKISLKFTAGILLVVIV